MAKQPKDALAGRGPIVDRARRALRQVAEEFGSVQEVGHTTVTVKTPAGLLLELGYAPGNYIFSRVYNLQLRMRVPHRIPNAKLQFSGGRARFVAQQGSSNEALTAVNKQLERLHETVDLAAGSITSVSQGEVSGGSVAGSANATGSMITLSPLGGSFVWVLIPPIFKAIAFPKGEPERLNSLLLQIARTLDS